MKWSEIRKQYPDKFILLGDISEEKISETKSRVIEGKILKVSDNAKEIRDAYQDCKNKGMNVIYSIPDPMILSLRMCCLRVFSNDFLLIAFEREAYISAI